MKFINIETRVDRVEFGHDDMTSGTWVNVDQIVSVTDRQIRSTLTHGIDYETFTQVRLVDGTVLETFTQDCQDILGQIGVTISPNRGVAA